MLSAPLGSIPRGRAVATCGPSGSDEQPRVSTDARRRASSRSAGGLCPLTEEIYRDYRVRNGLAAGGSRIRTRGPSAKGKAMGCHSRQALPSLDLNLLVAPPLVRPSPIGNAQKSLSQERDRWFESGSLQRRVCEPISLSCSVPSVDGSSLPSRAPRNAGPTADRRAMRAVSDEMVLTLSATGTADDVAARISALLKAGLKQAVLFPLAVDGDASGAIVRTIEALS